MTLAATSAAGQALRPIEPVPQDAFTSMEAPTSPRTSPTPTVKPGDWDMRTAGRWLAEELESQRPTPKPSASPEQLPTPRPEPKPETRATPRPSAPATSHSRTITASWYCNKDATRGPLSRCPRTVQDGLYAAISPDLESLRGKIVRVCYKGSCVSVKVIDCNCQAHESIDLFASAFSQLAPLSAGRLRGVTLSW
jgi:hypothetical protein